MPEVSDLAAAGESFARASFPASPLDLAFLSELAPALFSVIVESVRPGEMAACRHWRVEAEVVETSKVSQSSWGRESGELNPSGLLRMGIPDLLRSHHGAASQDLGPHSTPNKLPLIVMLSRCH
jgi:hypothetical protein